jgi:hypothetical protein
VLEKFREFQSLVESFFNRKIIVVQSIGVVSMKSFIPSLQKSGYLILFRALMLINKMAPQKGNIDIL